MIIKEREAVQKEVYDYIHKKNKKHSTLYTPKNSEVMSVPVGNCVLDYKPMLLPEYSKR